MKIKNTKQIRRVTLPCQGRANREGPLSTKWKETPSQPAHGGSEFNNEPSRKGITPMGVLVYRAWYKIYNDYDQDQIKNLIL